MVRDGHVCNRTRAELDGLLERCDFGAKEAMFACYFRRAAGGGEPVCVSCDHGLGHHGGGGGQLAHPSEAAADGRTPSQLHKDKLARAKQEMKTPPPVRDVVSTAAAAVAADKTKKENASAAPSPLPFHVYDPEADRVMTVRLDHATPTVADLRKALKDQHNHDRTVFINDWGPLGTARRQLKDVLGITVRGPPVDKPLPVAWTCGEPFRIMVQLLHGKYVGVTVFKHMTFAVVKRKLQEIVAVHVDSQRLIVAGKLAHDEDTIDQHGLQGDERNPQETIDLELRLRGGMHVESSARVGFGLPEPPASGPKDPEPNKAVPSSWPRALSKEELDVWARRA